MEETQKKKNPIIKKVLSVFVDALIVVYALGAIFAFSIAISSENNRDKTANVFGTELRFVDSDSMEECALTDVSNYKIKSIKNKSCVFIDSLPKEEEAKSVWYSNVKVGDVLTFKYVYRDNGTDKQLVMNHRVVEIEPKGESDYIYTLEGDNKNAEDIVGQQRIDTSIDDNSPNYVIGKVKGQNYLLGATVSALKTTEGILLIIVVPSLAVIVYEGIRIFRGLKQDRSEKKPAKEEPIVSAGGTDIAALKKELEEGQQQESERTQEKS